MTRAEAYKRANQMIDSMKTAEDFEEIRSFPNSDFFYNPMGNIIVGAAYDKADELGISYSL